MFDKYSLVPEEPRRVTVIYEFLSVFNHVML